MGIDCSSRGATIPIKLVSGRNAGQSSDSSPVTGNDRLGMESAVLPDTPDFILAQYVWFEAFELYWTYQ